MDGITHKWQWMDGWMGWGMAEVEVCILRSLKHVFFQVCILPIYGCMMDGCKGEGKKKIIGKKVTRRKNRRTKLKQ